MTHSRFRCLHFVQVDASDVCVWYGVGKMAVQLGDVRLARHAFEQGLACSSGHWPCLDELVGVLYAIGDDLACLHRIAQALAKDPYYVKGLVFRDRIFDEVSLDSIAIFTNS